MGAINSRRHKKKKISPSPVVPTAQELRICIMGDRGVGKASLMHWPHFQDVPHMTCGDATHQNAPLFCKRGDKIIQDTSLIIYYECNMMSRGCSGTLERTLKDIQCVIVMFDLTNLETTRNISKYLLEVERWADDGVTYVLVGNKSDMVEKRQVTPEDLVGVVPAYMLPLPYIEVSVCNGENVQLLLDHVAYCALIDDDDKNNYLDVTTEYQ